MKPNRSAATFESNEAVWRVHVKPVLGGAKLDELGVPHVTAMLRRLRNDAVSASMIDRILRVMHRAIAVATRQGRFNRPNPFAMVDRPKLAPPQTRALSIEEARRFIAAAGADHFEALWIVLITCGTPR